MRPRDLENERRRDEENEGGETGDRRPEMGEADLSTYRLINP
ncbi:hypothetical protein [Lunatibacter salilacus]|nr:hypothetical protein [Lunatibacter salilacus]